MYDAARRARLDGFIGALPDGFDTVVGDNGVRLSGGERQRLAIARALLRGSGIVILDEATSSLDVATEKLIQEAVGAALADRTAIVIAHRFSTIRHADRIIVLDGGEVAEEGALDGLLAKKGAFYRYWEEQRFY